MDAEDDGPPETLLDELTDEAAKLPKKLPDDLDRYEEDKDPIAELAGHVADFVSGCQPGEEEDLLRELRRFGGSNVNGQNAIEARIHEYCELDGTMYPTDLLSVQYFKFWVRGAFREKGQKPPSIDIVAHGLGFSSPWPSSNSIAKIQSSLKKRQGYLQSLVEGRDDGDATDIRASWTEAFASLERLLTQIISFYGRLLTGDFSGQRNFIPAILSYHDPAHDKHHDSSQELITWGKTFNDEKKTESISVISALSLITTLNKMLLNSSQIPTGFGRHFGRGHVLSLERIEKVKQFYNDHSPDTAASKKDPKPEAILKIVDWLIPFVRELANDGVVPPIHILERRITMGYGITRLDCRDEDVRHQYRFRGMVPFYSSEECFLSVAINDQERAATNRVCKYPPIILPVDINCRKEPI